MSYRWTHYRDRILIDEKFTKILNDIIKSKAIPTGSTLLLAARDLKVAPGYHFRFPGYNLVLLADRLDAAAGVDVSGLNGNAGREGDRGHDGSHTATSGTPGTAGSKGGNGSLGGDGMSVAVMCKELVGLRIEANWGPGGMVVLVETEGEVGPHLLEERRGQEAVEGTLEPAAQAATEATEASSHSCSCACTGRTGGQKSLALGQRLRGRVRSGRHL